ncbi:MAG: cardiolipin synthase [Bacillota bacterium]|nr:cardiolipin synthase [Bacillota bacterium]
MQRGRKGLLRALFSRLGIIVLLLLLQIAVILLLFYSFAEYAPHIYTATTILAAAVVLYLINSGVDPTGKVTWLIVITLIPVFGGLLLLYTQLDVGHRTVKSMVSHAIDSTRDAIPQDPKVLENLAAENPDAAALAHYISRSGCYPVYDSTDVTYFPLGEDMFEALLPQLERAERFIFLEYFIIDEGLMWGRVLDILAKKARAGVDVRVMYDGTCEFSTLSRDYPKLLRGLGIQCKVFSPATPFLSTHYNYRDHRKILVIDGHTAFTGGINMADEYINRIEKHGHWKDTAILLQGEAVRSFTLMFLQLWNLFEKEPVYEPFLSCPTYPPRQAKGFVIPYADCPLDRDKVGERVYMDILNRARHYVHIMSPYLILDGEMETALKFAAERGVDVALILPGIPDKKIPFALALTHYASLLESGVRLYEYTPGFVHAKVFVSDDSKAVVGTINMDYRSFYHHFECAAYLYGTPCILAIERDFQDTLQKCRPVTRETLKNESAKRKLTGFLCKTVAPLM